MTLLSICIPCYGRVEYVRKTLKSIFIDNADVPLEKYEVIISDNDSNQAIKVLTEEFKYPNLRYFLYQLRRIHEFLLCVDLCTRRIF